MIKKLAALTCVAWLLITGMITPAAHASVAPYRWPYKIVYVEDHTGVRWPVHEAALSWDVGTDVSVRYGACRAGAGCIRAYEGYYGRTGRVGMTVVSWNPTNGVIYSVRILLNDSYALDAHQRRQTACHEEGHGLGLWAERTSLSSCLYYVATDRASAYPDSLDRARLNLRY